MALATVEDAKTYLRLTGTTDFDDELALKVPQACAIVLDYITVAEEDLADTDLLVAQCVALECVKSLMGDEEPALGPAQKNLLWRLRDPTLA